MAWRRPGDKPLSEPMMVCLLTHICVTRPQWVKTTGFHGDVIKCKHFPHHWGIHRSRKSVTRSFDISLICAWTNRWANNLDAGDLGRHCAHYDVTVFLLCHNFSRLAELLRAAVSVKVLSPWLFAFNALTYMSDKQRVLMRGHQGWNIRHGLCHIYMRYVYIYIWVVYSLCFFCCLFITVTWWYVWCIEWASGNQEEKYRHVW